MAAIVLLLAACGDSGGGDAAGGGGAAVNAEAAKILADGYRGHFLPPPSRGPKAVRGKTVWNISCGQAYATCALMAQQVEEAGKELGWKVVTQDSKGDPSLRVSLLKQAVAAKVDAITVQSDCPDMKTGLLAARAAKVPVVAFSSDCDDPGFARLGKRGDPLFTATVNIMGSRRLMDYYRAWSTARAQYLVARLPDGGKILHMRETSSLVELTIDSAFESLIKRECPKCRLVPVDFAFNQVPNPATQIWKSGILANPDSVAIGVGSDQLFGIGMQTAIQQSPLRGKNVIVVGGEGGKLNYELIRQGTQTASVPLPYAWLMWGLADTLNRVFAGENPQTLPSEGGGWQFVDKEHNLPPSGTQYNAPVDFRSAYKKIWSGS